jgi:hypothetical protein
MCCAMNSEDTILKRTEVRTKIRNFCPVSLSLVIPDPNNPCRKKKVASFNFNNFSNYIDLLEESTYIKICGKNSRAIFIDKL